MERRSCKCLALLLTLICCFIFFSCGETLSDVVPKEYGEWDGNYIYSKNLRCKTTGEEDTVLVSKIIRDGVEYTVTETTDYLYIGEELYMCLTVEALIQEETTTCFVRYNVKEKTTKVIYWEIDDLKAAFIFKISQKFILLETSEGHDELLFKIDYQGNIVSENEEYPMYNLMIGDMGDYFLEFEDNTFCYYTLDDSERKKMFSVPNGIGFLSPYDYVEQGERKGFLFLRSREETYYETYYTMYCGIYFYDLTEDKLYDIFSIVSSTETMIIRNDFILVGTPTIRKYIGTSRRSGCESEKEERTYYGYENCKLYQIDYKTMTVVECFDFSKEYAKNDFSDFIVLSKDVLYFSSHKLSKGLSCQGEEASVKETHYALDVKTKKFKKVSVEYKFDWSKEHRTEIALKNGAYFGQYVYYFQADDFGSFLQERVFTLQRYDTKTGKTIAMQSWIYSSPSDTYQVESEGDILTLRHSPGLQENHQNSYESWEVETKLDSKILVRNY